MLMKEGDANPDGPLNENRRKRQATQDRPAVDDRPQHDAKAVGAERVEEEPDG